MRRFATAFALVAALLVGSISAAPEAAAAPAAPEVEQRFERPDHYFSHAQAVDQCRWRRAQVGLTGYWAAVREFHYGTAHITQCWFRSWEPCGWGCYSYCDQYTWNIPNPYWDRYKEGWYPTACW